jgi:hypothetical protein
MVCIMGRDPKKGTSKLVNTLFVPIIVMLHNSTLLTSIHGEEGGDSVVFEEFPTIRANFHPEAAA